MSGKFTKFAKSKLTPAVLKRLKGTPQEKYVNKHVSGDAPKMEEKEEVKPSAPIEPVVSASEPAAEKVEPAVDLSALKKADLISYMTEKGFTGDQMEGKTKKELLEILED